MKTAFAGSSFKLESAKITYAEKPTQERGTHNPLLLKALIEGTIGEGTIGDALNLLIYYTTSL